MSWNSYEGVDSCVIGQEYSFEKTQIVAAVRMAWFEEDTLHTATVDKSARPIIRHFDSAIYMGEPDECRLFRPEEIAPEIRALNCAKGFFVGRANEDDHWYVFIAVSNPDEEDAGGFELK